MKTPEQFTTRQFIEELARLEFPDPSGVVLNHSAALATWGKIPAKEVGDIDAAISWENTQYLRRKVGWNVTRKIVGYRDNGAPIQLIITQDDDQRFDLHRWDFSAKRWQETGQGRIYIPEMQFGGTQDAETSIYVASESHVIETMTDTGRPKDAERLRRMHTAD